MEGDNRREKYSQKRKREELEELVKEYEEFMEVEPEEISVDESDNSIVEFPTQNSLHSDAIKFVESGCCNDIPYEDNSETSDSDSEIVLEPTCNEIKDLQKWAVVRNIAHVHIDELLQILRRRVLPDLPKSTKTLLKCDNKYNNHIEPMKVSDGTDGEFIYIGMEDHLKTTVNPKLHDSDTLELIFNIDGFSPFKSSPAVIWPILCKVYTKIDVYEPFTVAVYAGNGKPENSHDYLEKFVIEINKLLSQGVTINNKKYHVKIKFFVCDMPARAFVKKIVGHTGFSACERCEVLGEKKDGVTVFLALDAKKRTGDDFRYFADPAHHDNGASMLREIKPEIDLVKLFILDPMHLLYLGCIKRMMESLLSQSNLKIRLSPTLKKELIRRTKLIYKDIPDEHPRKMRDTTHWAKYKAVEDRFMANYAAIVVFKKLLPNDIYEHFLRFSIACRLLSCKNAQNNLDKARQHFRTFVEKAPGLYGSRFVSLNVHNLIHICDDVKSTGCDLNEISSFSFESYLGSFGRVMRSPQHLVKQYCRRLEEKEKFAKEEVVAPVDFLILRKQKRSIIKLKYSGWILSVAHPNSTVFLEDKSIAEICQFHEKDNKILVEIRKYLKREPIFESPCDSSTVDIWEVSRLSISSIIVPLENIKGKFVNFQMNYSVEEENRSFVVPLLH